MYDEVFSFMCVCVAIQLSQHHLLNFLGTFVRIQLTVNITVYLGNFNSDPWICVPMSGPHCCVTVTLSSPWNWVVSGLHLWSSFSELFEVLCIIRGKGNGTPLRYSCLENPMDRGVWWAAVHGVAKSGTRLSDFTFTFHFHELEKEMATHSSVLAWRIPGMEEPGGPPSMGLHRVWHDWSDLAAAAL